MEVASASQALRIESSVISHMLGPPQAVQAVAATLAPFEGEARRTMAMEVREGLVGVSRALGNLPTGDSPCFREFHAQLGYGKDLCDHWIEWWDEVQFLPQEAAMPEPELTPLLGAMPTKPGVRPVYADPILAAVEDLIDLAYLLDDDSRRDMRGVITLAQEKAASLANVLRWPALEFLSRELNEAAGRVANFN